MTAHERVIKMFGGIDKVPEYLLRALGLREAAQKSREKAQRKHEERKKREQERIKSLRRPPRNVQLHLIFGGRKGKVTWEPPETAGELKPAGYWVSEERNGEWTAHGDYVLPHIRSAVLFGTGPARVETWYHQMALEESYPASAVPVVDTPAVPTDLPSDPNPHADLIETVRGYLTAKGRPPGYYDRWRRVLAGLGAETHANPMKADEAQSYVDRGWGDRWPPVVKALREMTDA